MVAKSLRLTALALLLTACTTPPPAAPLPFPPVASAPSVEVTPPPAPRPVVTPPPPVAQKPAPVPRIALALGGGAAKGFAHVGVIRQLEKAGLRADIVAGTSAGAVVGAIYASGLSGEQLYRRALAMNEDDLKDFTLSASGFLKGDKLQAFINRQVGRKRIEQLPRRFAAVATNFDTGERSPFTQGDTGLAVRASAAIPNVFQPVSIKGRRYVDGGLVSPVPVVTARELGADIVIAVDISSKPVQRKSGLFGTLDQSLTIMNQAALQLELKQADVILRPRVLGVGAADFDQRSRAIREGEKVGREAIPVIRRVLAAWQARQR